jgi:hypothetical protein
VRKYRHPYLQTLFARELDTLSREVSLYRTMKACGKRCGLSEPRRHLVMHLAATCAISSGPASAAPAARDLPGLRARGLSRDELGKLIAAARSEVAATLDARSATLGEPHRAG